LIPKQANKATIALTLSPASPNTTTNASTVANASIAKQISAKVAVGVKPNAILS